LGAPERLAGVFIGRLEAERELELGFGVRILAGAIVDATQADVTGCAGVA
jgi:hypothetical protein